MCKLVDYIIPSHSANLSSADMLKHLNYLVNADLLAVHAS